MAKSKPIKEGAKLTAYAPFELLGKVYEAGDEFTLPAGWTRDAEFEIFRNLDRPRGAANGIAILEPITVLDGKGKPNGDNDARRHILPLKEE